MKSAPICLVLLGKKREKKKAQRWTLRLMSDFKRPQKKRSTGKTPKGSPSWGKEGNWRRRG